MDKTKIKNDNPVLKTNCEANFKICLADDKIVGRIGNWTIPIETHEEKIERLRLDILKKKYPVFLYVEDIIRKVKSSVKIYNNDIMREICLGAASFLICTYI